MKSRIFDNDEAKILTFNQGVRGSNPRWFTKREPDEHFTDPLYGWRRVRFGLWVTKMKEG